MVRLTDPPEGNPLATAQALAAQGLQVLPARFRDKSPIVKWTQYQDIRTDSLLAQWFHGSTPRNYWVMTGRMSGVIVIDCDNPEADRWWRDHLGAEVMDSAGQVKTRNGTHYWFRLPEGWDQPTPGWACHNGDLEFDVRADGGGVIVPPSVHETGHIYEWVRPLAEASEAPPGLLDGSLRALAPAGGSEAAGGSRKGQDGTVRSMLSSLLGAPPTGEGSGRNDWLTKVCGHYAKTYHNQEDLYRAHADAAAAMLQPPLDEKEADKTVSSVWKGEHERNPQRALDWDCGWLQSAGTATMTQVAVKRDGKEGGTSYELAEYGNFDLVAKGVMLAEDGSRTYWVQIVRRDPLDSMTKVIDAILPAQTLGDDKKFRGWLARWACQIIPPLSIWPKEGSPGQRFQRYLESQRPAAVKVTSTLGWDEDILGGDGGFLTHDGVITASEVLTCEQAGARPDPQLQVGGKAPHRYGFEGSRDEARRVLEEVMSFHNPETTAVFGAWWAACLVKAQIEHRTALFPFMAIEAPSESGKTNGFFDLMTQLNGNTRGETAPTKAALRDMAASHRNGLVWVDDLDDPGYLMELLRAATSGGSLTKMGEDRDSVVNTKIVSPVVISGEALGLGSQKALLDRAIILQVQSPTGRLSRHGDHPQWDDVIALREQYPRGLSDVAGWLVQEALGGVEHVLQVLKEGRRGASGRTADKHAILRSGARLLDHMLAAGLDDQDDLQAQAWAGQGSNAQQVERWISAAEASGVASNENSLTLEVLPWALRTFKYPDKPYAGEHDRDLDRPVFLRTRDRSVARMVQGLLGDPVTDDQDGVEVWFSTALLAQAWEREKHGRVQGRTQSETAFKQQANVLGATSKQFKIVGGGNRRASFRMISGSMAKRILDRAEGNP